MIKSQFCMAALLYMVVYADPVGRFFERCLEARHANRIIRGGATIAMLACLTAGIALLAFVTEHVLHEMLGLPRVPAG